MCCEVSGEKDYTESERVELNHMIVCQPENSCVLRTRTTLSFSLTRAGRTCAEKENCKKLSEKHKYVEAGNVSVQFMLVRRSVKFRQNTSELCAAQ